MYGGCNRIRAMQKLIIPNDVLLGEVVRLVSEGEKVTIMTKGFSMLPFIIGGEDSVLLEAPKEIFPGIIALAQIRDGYYVLHRIISVEGEMVTLMGDGNLRGCEVCRMNDIVAVATMIKKKDRQIDCLSRQHLLKARIWKALLPARRWILAVYRRIFI